MNFEPDHILAPQHGNNANARVSSVRIMNRTQPTELQLGQLAHQFKLHKMNLAASLGGYLVRNGKLADGSVYRIVSNSGLHTLMLWPEGGAPRKPEDLLRVFCIPSNTDVPYGWIPPAVEGQNGTPGDAGADDAGVTFNLEKKQDGTPLKGKHLKRYQTVIAPFVHNAALFAEGDPNNTSAQRWENREWVSKDRKTCVTTYDSIRINGVSLGSLVSGALWACLHDYDPGDGKHTFLVVVALNGKTLTVERAPLGSSSFTTIATLDLHTLDTAAVSDVSNGFATLRSWVGKIAHNRSQSVLSVWVQNPNAEAIGANAFSSTSFFVGTVDFNMGTGELIAATPAEGETIAVGRTSSPGNNSGTFATSGTRQIGFGYNGDTKVFTGLQFSGAFTGVQTYVGPIGFGIAGDYVYQWTGTDSRQVHLVHGSFSQLVAFADVATDTEERSGHKFSSGDFTVTSSDVQYAAAIQTATLLYHNGAPVFEVASSHYDAAETIGSSSAEIASTVKVYVAGDVLDLGVSTGTLAGATRAGTQLTTGIVGDFRVPSFIDTGTTTRWGCAGQQNMALLSPSGFLSFAAPGAADESPFNGRAVDDFAIVSVPMLKPTPGIGAGTYVLDPARFYTYCTDTAIIEKINAGDVNSVLKGISLR